ncbi:MAG: hypothetical protein V3T23_13650, partial [Nitrososphaerales archaeon]
MATDDLSTYLTPVQPEQEDELNYLSKYLTPEELPEEPATDVNIDNLSEALQGGWLDAKAAWLSSRVVAGAGGTEAAAEALLEAIKGRPTIPEAVQKYQEGIMAEGRDVSEAEGMVDTTVEFVDLMSYTLIESIKNPGATVYTISQSLAHSIPSIALGAAGAISPIPGGMAIGSGLGSFMTEAGAHLNQLLQEKMREQGRDFRTLTEDDIATVLDSPEFMDWARTESVKAGAAVAITEAIMAHAGSKIITGGIKKAEKQGVKQTAGSVGRRASAAFAIEVAGEGTGEFVKQVVTEGDVEFGEVALETVSGLGQAAGTTAIAQTLDQARQAVTKPKDDLDKLFGEGVDDIPGDALDKLNAGREEVPTEAEPETPQSQIVAAAMDIINKHPDLVDAAAGLSAKGELDATIPYAMLEIAENTQHALRTDGQKELLAYGREQTKKDRSPAEAIGAALAGETDLVDEAAPEVMDDQTRFDMLSKIDRNALTEGDREFLDTFEVAPEEVVTEEVVPEVVVTEEAVPSVAELDSQIQQITADTPLDAPTKQAQLKELTAQREEQVKTEIDLAAQEAQTSPTSPLPTPTQEQLESGEYKKGLVDVQGIGI